MLTQYLFIFAQVHDDFRIPELLSISELYGFEIKFPEDRDTSSPFMILGLEGEEHARLLARRCILIRYICEFYARGKSYEEVHERNRTRSSLWEKYIEDTSFKFLVTSFNHTIPQWRQKDVVESFSYMEFRGKIEMKNPGITLTVFEEYPDKHGTTREKTEGDGEFDEVWFGRLIEVGSARPLAKTFDVKKRVYYGNTSMEAEMSLLMANQTLASPGKLIYDPFIGTGSMAYTTAHFGAFVFGSDIDGRQMRGKELFDAIVTDPPYGVRAGAKRLGRKDNRPLREGPPPVHVERPDDQPYVPPTKPYELSELARDLVILARYMLKPRGRLVFFLPTVTEEYEELDIQAMLCDGMELVANSLQNFGSWGRRLITIRKTTTEAYPPPTFDPAHAVTENVDVHVPAHKDFREKYFHGFKKNDISIESGELALGNE
ncbi:tRNA guanosine-2'-O-methyltransferase [Ganoderma leucocontextum]|nr:tRNA guanosine-2'-O-methyltransferase [Ganoderma leucocontextum]